MVATVVRMMHRYVHATVAWLIAVMASAQPYWALDAGSLGNDHVADIGVDADGSVYVTGEYGGSLQFGGQSLGPLGAQDVFVARLDAAGQVIWLRRAGGTGIDRGLKISVGNGAALAVAGEFMGTANLFGTTVTSAGGTTDMFVALINKTDGTLQWVRQGGGALGSDSPGGVSIGPNNEVAVAGQFRGTAQWDGSILTSTTDPGTGQPGADVFIANYSSTGALLWLKQGVAPENDDVAGLAHDATGNLYVTGQFSDTLTFDIPHPGNVLNASYLVRFSPNGTEEWFRHMGGAVFNQVRGLAISSNGALFLAGDLQGSMVWAGNTNVTIVGSGPYAYYLLKVGLDGQLLEQVSMGSSSGVSVGGIAEQGTKVAVFGAFHCQFNDLAGFYAGNGLFMATGTEDLFMAMHRTTDLALQEAQQFGGTSAKVPGAVHFLPGGQAVCCGSFQGTLIFPSEPGFTAEISTESGTLVGNGADTYCGDPNYGSFAGLASAGVADGFLARGYVQGRAPYDWWYRTGNDCQRSQAGMCIQALNGPGCLDTISFCEGIPVTAGLPFSHVGVDQRPAVGPVLDIAWNDGALDLLHSAVPGTATFGAQVASQNGCWHWADTAVVIVHAKPVIQGISDDAGINTDAMPPVPIELCHPEVVWAWGSVPQDCTPSWTGPGGQIVQNDSILVDTTGFYNYVVTDPFGCFALVLLQAIDHPNVSLDGLGMTMAIEFPLDTDLDDTVTVCPHSNVGFSYIPSWTINGVPVDHVPAGLDIHYGLFPEEPNTPATDGQEGAAVMITAEGWHSFHVVVRVDNGACGDTLYFHAVDSVYVQFFPVVDLNAQITGPSVICDGDTALFTATCNGCDSLLWSSAGGQPYGTMGYQVWAPGAILLTAMNVDTNGCVNLGYGYAMITMPTSPVLSVSPPDGIICPGATAVISTTAQGNGAIWYGPFGALPGLGTMLTTATPGTYYLSLVVQGCVVTSNNVVLTQYGTPSLALGSGQALCHPGDTVALHVMAAPGAEVQWAAPLAGNAWVQMIDQPGTYSCSVSSCGITTTLSVDIPLAPVQASVLTQEPFVICPGDTLLLQAANTTDSCVWLPGMESGPALPVTQPGSYFLLVTNSAGCSDTSAALLVTAQGFSSPLHAVGDTVCAGDTAVLVASGSGSITWYAGMDAVSLLGTGSPFLYQSQAGTWLFVRQQEGACTSQPDSVRVEVYARPDDLFLSGPDSLCLGDALLITAEGADTLLCTWNTPSGTVQGGSVSISSVALGDMGNYVCTASYRGCVGLPATHELVVHAPDPLGFPDLLTLCSGATATLQLPTGSANVLWSNGSTGMSIVLSGPGVVGVQATDINGCAVQGQVQVVLDDCSIVVPNVFTPNGDGINDTWLPTGGYVAANAEIWNRWGNLVFTGNVAGTGWDGRSPAGTYCSDGTYFYTLEIRRADGTSEPFTGSFLLNGSGR
jgi:gliding motility-associated-like protein